MCHHLSWTLWLCPKIYKCIWSDAFCSLYTKIVTAFVAFSAWWSTCYRCLSAITLLLEIASWQGWFQLDCSTTWNKSYTRHGICYSSGILEKWSLKCAAHCLLYWIAFSLLRNCRTFLQRILNINCWFFLLRLLLVCDLNISVQIISKATLLIQLRFDSLK